MRDSLVHPAQASPPSLPELPQGRGPQLVSLLCFSQPPVAFMFSDIVMFHSLSRCARRPPQRLLPLAIPTVPFRPPIHIGALPIRNQCFTGSLPTLSDAIAVPSKRPSDSACSWSLQYFAGSPPPHPPARAPPPSRWCPATHRGARPALAPRSLAHSLTPQLTVGLLLFGPRMSNANPLRCCTSRAHARRHPNRHLGGDWWCACAVWRRRRRRRQQGA